MKNHFESYFSKFKFWDTNIAKDLISSGLNPYFELSKKDGSNCYFFFDKKSIIRVEDRDLKKNVYSYSGEIKVFLMISNEYKEVSSIKASFCIANKKPYLFYYFGDWKILKQLVVSNKYFDTIQDEMFILDLTSELENIDKEKPSHDKGFSS